MEILNEGISDQVVVLSHDRYNQNAAISILWASNNLTTKEALQHLAATLRKVAKTCDNMGGLPEREILTLLA